MVGKRGQDLHPSAGEGTCPIRTQVASKTSGASVAVEVVRNHFMCRGQILCHVFAGFGGVSRGLMAKCLLHTRWSGTMRTGLDS